MQEKTWLSEDVKNGASPKKLGKEADTVWTATKLGLLTWEGPSYLGSASSTGPANIYLPSHEGTSTEPPGRSTASPRIIVLTQS